MFQKILLYFIPVQYTLDEEYFRKAKLTVGAFFIIACFNLNYILISKLIDYDGGLYSQVPLFFASVLSL